MIGFTFACGARLPQPGKLSVVTPAQAQTVHRLVVWTAGGNMLKEEGWPRHPDGQGAACNSCPVKREARWRKVQCWPDDPDRARERQWDWYITCKATPIVIPEEALR